MKVSKDNVVLAAVALVMAVVSVSQFLFNGTSGVALGTSALVVAVGLAVIVIVTVTRKHGST